MIGPIASALGGLVPALLGGKSRKASTPLFAGGHMATIEKYQKALAENLGRPTLFSTYTRGDRGLQGNYTQISREPFKFGYTQRWEQCEYCDGRVSLDATDCHRCGAPLPKTPKVFEGEPVTPVYRDRVTEKLSGLIQAQELRLRTELNKALFS